MGTSVVNGVTYVNSSGSVRFADIASAFGNDVNQMSELRSRKWYKSDFTRGNLPSSGNISLSSLRGLGGSIPRVNRSQYPAAGQFFQSGNISIPKFNTIMFTVYGGGGGGGGFNGQQCVQYNQYFQCISAITVNGGAGGNGGTTTITYGSNTASAAGGSGGNQGVAGASGTAWSAGDVQPGGSGNGNGGAGGSTRTATINADTNYASAVALWDTICSVSYGAAGAGGNGGVGNQATGTAGNNGSAGAVSIFIDYGLY